jgi:hypothetical protein
MTHPIYEGTWEEVSNHARELRGKRVRVIILDEPTKAEPNQLMLDVLKKLEERHKGKPFTDGGDTQRILREARAGQMFGDDTND